MFSHNANNRDTFTNRAIILTNVTDGEIFCYSLPIIKGYISSFRIEDESKGKKEKRIVLRKLNENENNNNNNNNNNNGDDCGEDEEKTTVWPVVNGNFKCLADLRHGKNVFSLEFENDRLRLNLEFESKKISHHVLPVYIVCEGHDGRFQAPEGEDNSPASACKRISIGSKLIQSLTAEKLFESNMGKRTFALAGDANRNLNCVLFRSKLTPEDVYGMEPEEIWENFARELMSSRYGSEKRKFLAFLSCTEYVPRENEPETYEEIVGRMRGHVALGGGGLAIFGTGCLHTWPETIGTVLTKFLDETKVDKNKFMDDSCYRGTYGSCFSTTLGSVCHELGHAFDLGHSKKGIMGRGFDNINLVFTIGNQSRDANRNTTARNEGQHSTVCFTRNLNVTYCMSSPIKRIGGKNREGIQGSGSPRKNQESDGYRNKNVNPNELTRNDVCEFNTEKKKSAINSKALTEDLTFWDKSCSVLLKYHRWFANSEIPDHLMSSIEFDASRSTIYSSSGIRVVELRNDDGLVLDSWEFLNTYLPKQFTLPIDNINMKYVKLVVAEDSVGNILKEPLSNM